VAGYTEDGDELYNEEHNDESDHGHDPIPAHSCAWPWRYKCSFGGVTPMAVVGSYGHACLISPRLGPSAIGSGYKWEAGDPVQCESDDRGTREATDSSELCGSHDLP
jgi:hypothetical protein